MITVQLAVVMWVLVAAQCVNTCWSTLSRAHAVSLEPLEGVDLEFLSLTTFASAEDLSGLSMVDQICLSVIELMFENSKVSLTPFSFTGGLRFLKCDINHYIMPRGKR